MKTKRPTLPADERFYTPDAPCKRGHMAPRYTRTKACTECAREKFFENKETLDAQARNRRRTRTPEEIEAERKYKRIWMYHKRNPGALHVEELGAPPKPPKKVVAELTDEEREAATLKKRRYMRLWMHRKRHPGIPHPDETDPLEGL